MQRLSGSRALSEMMAMVRARFGRLIGVWAVFFGLQLVGLVGVFGAIAAMGMGAAALASGQTPPLGMIPAILVLYLALMAIALARGAALTNAASPLVDPAVGDSLRAGFGATPTLGALILLMLLAIIPAAIVLGAIVGVLGAIGLRGLLGFVVVIAFLIGMPWLMTRISLLNPVIAVDGTRGPINALRQSWGMTRGSALKMFLTYGVLLVGAIILLGLVYAPMIGTMASMQPGQVPDLGALGGSFAFSSIAGIFAGAVVEIAFAALIAAIHAQLSDHSGARLADAFE